MKRHGNAGAAWKRAAARAKQRTRHSRTISLFSFSVSLSLSLDKPLAGGLLEGALAPAGVLKEVVANDPAASGVAGGG